MSSSIQSREDPNHNLAASKRHKGYQFGLRKKNRNRQTIQREESNATQLDSSVEQGGINSPSCDTNSPEKRNNSQLDLTLTQSGTIEWDELEMMISLIFIRIVMGGDLTYQPPSMSAKNYENADRAGPGDEGTMRFFSTMVFKNLRAAAMEHAKAEAKMMRLAPDLKETRRRELTERPTLLKKIEQELERVELLPAGMVRARASIRRLANMAWRAFCDRPNIPVDYENYLQRMVKKWPKLLTYDPSIFNHHRGTNLRPVSPMVDHEQIMDKLETARRWPHLLLWDDEGCYNAEMLEGEPEESGPMSDPNITWRQAPELTRPAFETVPTIHEYMPLPTTDSTNIFAPLPIPEPTATFPPEMNSFDLSKPSPTYMYPMDRPILPNPTTINMSATTGTALRRPPLNTSDTFVPLLRPIATSNLLPGISSLELPTASPTFLAGRMHLSGPAAGIERSATTVATTTSSNDDSGQIISSVSDAPDNSQHSLDGNPTSATTKSKNSHPRWSLQMLLND